MAAGSGLELVLAEGSPREDRPELIPLPPDGCTLRIGRRFDDQGSSHQVVLNNSQGSKNASLLSRVHADLWLENGVVMLADGGRGSTTGTMNGTAVNGGLVPRGEAIAVPVGAEVEFGVPHLMPGRAKLILREFVYRLTSSVPAATQAAPASASPEHSAENGLFPPRENGRHDPSLMPCTSAVGNGDERVAAGRWGAAGAAGSAGMASGDVRVGVRERGMAGAAATGAATGAAGAGAVGAGRSRAGAAEMRAAGTTAARAGAAQTTAAGAAARQPERGMPGAAATRAAETRVVGTDARQPDEGIAGSRVEAEAARAKTAGTEAEATGTALTDARQPVEGGRRRPHRYVPLRADPDASPLKRTRQTEPSANLVANISAPAPGQPLPEAWPQPAPAPAPQLTPQPQAAPLPPPLPQPQPQPQPQPLAMSAPPRSPKPQPYCGADVSPWPSSHETRDATNRLFPPAATPHAAVRALPPPRCGLPPLCTLPPLCSPGWPADIESGFEDQSSGYAGCSTVHPHPPDCPPGWHGRGSDRLLLPTKVHALVRHAMPHEDSQSQNDATETDRRIDAARTSLLASLAVSLSSLSPPLALPDAALQVLWRRAVDVQEGTSTDGAGGCMPAVAALRASGAGWLADAAVKVWLERAGATAEAAGRPGPGEIGDEWERRQKR